MKKKVKSAVTPTAPAGKKVKKDSIPNVEKTLDVKVESSSGHPLSIGHNIMVKYRDGSHRTAKVIERSSHIQGATTSWQYYVHYHEFNRRMDEWIDVARIIATDGVVVDDHHGHGDVDSSAAVQDNVDSSGDASPALKRARTQHGDEEPVNEVLRETSGATALGGVGGSKVTTIAELGYDEHEGLDEASLLEHEEITKIKNIRNVVFGKHKLECWYFSPFPKEFHPNGPVECLYFCEFTLRFFKTKNELVRYQSHPTLPRHPPGNEIYRDSRVSMFELDGAVEKIYCQNLCYFAKLFLDHKVGAACVLVCMPLCDVHLTLTIVLHRLCTGMWIRFCFMFFVPAMSADFTPWVFSARKSKFILTNNASSRALQS